MAAITIKDLAGSRILDHQAMTCIRGAGGAGWVFGWITPFSSAPSGGGAVYILNQYFVANQISFQNQTTDVYNTGASASINVGANQASANTTH